MVKKHEKHKNGIKHYKYVIYGCLIALNIFRYIVVLNKISKNTYYPYKTYIEKRTSAYFSIIYFTILQFSESEPPGGYFQNLYLLYPPLPCTLFTYYLHLFYREKFGVVFFENVCYTNSERKK